MGSRNTADLFVLCVSAGDGWWDVERVVFCVRGCIRVRVGGGKGKVWVGAKCLLNDYSFLSPHST